MVRTGGPGKRLGMPLGFRRFPARLTVAMLGIVAVLSAARAPAQVRERAHAYPVLYQSLVDGERLEYEAGWNGIPGATAILTTSRLPEGGRYMVTGELWTRGYISWLWSTHDTIKARIDNGLWPLDFELRMIERSRLEVRNVAFSCQESTIHVIRLKRGKTQEYTIPCGLTYDPVTVAFLLRAITLKPGDSPNAEVCEGKEVYRVGADVVGVEKVKLGKAVIPAYKLKASLKRIYPPEEPKSKKKKKFYWATLWLSADELRIPLRLEAKVFVGHIYIKLVTENRGLAKRY